MRPKTADRRTRPLLLAALAALAVAGCAGADSDKAGSENKPKATVLTLANGNDDARNLEPFAAEVERLSGGALRIEFKNAWRAGDPNYETRVIRDVQAGKADLGWAGSRAFDDVDVASFDALHAPLLIDSYQLQRKVLESPVVPEMLDGLEPLDLVGVGVLPGPIRKPLGVSRLLAPEDYEGRTVAFQRSQVAEETLRALGARAAEIPSAGAIDAYDGIEQHVSSIAGNEYDKVATYLAANVNLWPRPVVLFMNQKEFEGLDDRQRSALRGAARAALPATIALERADEEEGAAVLCRRSVRFVMADEADLEALGRAVQPVYDRLERHAGSSAAIAQIRAMRSDAASPPDAPACSGPSPEREASGTTTPIDGIYRLTTTREESAKASGESPEQTFSENYGEWRFVFSRGKLRYTQASEGASRWTKAVYSVKGNTLTIRIVDYGGEAPNGAAEKTGDVFTYGWSLYRDRLTLEPVDGKISPAGWLVKPWRRVDDAP